MGCLRILLSKRQKTTEPLIQVEKIQDGNINTCSSLEIKKRFKDEKDYLFKYNLEVYSKLYNYLNINEKRWLASFIY